MSICNVDTLCVSLDCTITSVSVLVDEAALAGTIKHCISFGGILPLWPKIGEWTILEAADS